MTSARTTLPNFSGKRSALADTKEVKKRPMACEIRRLSTFHACNLSPRSVWMKSQLAHVGFVYRDEDQKLQCSGCHLQLSLSQLNGSLTRDDVQHDPQCPFAAAIDQLFSEKTQSKACTTCYTHSPPHTNVSLCDEQEDILPPPSFLDNLPLEIVLKMRIATFTNWPLITPNAQSMIAAGWTYTNIADRVICLDCNAIFHRWSETDQPYEIHRLKSPRCRFVLACEKTVAHLRSSALPIPITNEPQVGALVGAANEFYALSSRRSDTFQNWPHTEENPLPPVELFVEAGFYYTGDKTIVRCFYCNNALRNWQASDQPKIEHARWFPQCTYIRQYVGEDLYQAIQSKNRALKAQQNAQVSQTGPWTADELDRMVKARLDLPIVNELRAMGFTLALIRKVFQMQLSFKKDDFKTDNDLKYACLVLDRQVTLINGDNPVLLVPQDWSKKHREHLKQSTLRSSEVKLPVQDTAVGTPKEPVPKIVQSLPPPEKDDDSTLCVSCLSADRQVACLPCGHLASCVPCGHSMKTCPLCRAPVKAFVRIYL